MIIIKRSDLRPYTEKQQAYAYRLACQILERQPTTATKKGYTEADARLMLRNFSLEQMKEALEKLKAGEEVRFDYA